VINHKTVLAVIPARGGSKRLPQKNILPLAGKPLIKWTIEASLYSRYIDKVVVSSDDEEILKISVNAGAEIIRRPKELAIDEASSFSVVEHVLSELEYNPDYLALMQPTSPLRNNKHIDEAIELLISKKVDAVISVCETEHSPLWMNTLPKNGSMNQFIKTKFKELRSQDLPIYYRLNGAIYLSEIHSLITNRSFWGDQTKAYIMPKKKSIDIDTSIDFELCKILINENN